jgi:hypothetical protein
MTNPSGKWHDSDSYSATVRSLNEYDWIDDFDSVKKRFRVNGIDFEIRESKEDKHDLKIIKRDKDGECLYIKDKNGNSEYIYYSMEEKEKIFPEDRRYKYEHAVIESKTNKIVAMTQDEWGALLITSAKEFKGFALGQELLNYHRKQFPIRDSGGHTPQGYQAVFKFYQEEVKNALIRGEYRKEIKENRLTTEKVKEIISSARLSESTITRDVEYNRWNLGDKTYREKKEHKKTKIENWDMSDTRDIMMLVDDNYAILYNKKSLDDIENTEREYFVERGLLGYVYIGGVLDSESIPKVHRIYGKNEKIENFMMEVAFNISQGEQLRVYAEEDYLISDTLRESLDDSGYDLHSEHKIYQLNNKTNQLIDVMKFVEKKYRTSIDPYNEKKMTLEELIYGLSEDIETSREKITEIILNNIGNNKDTRRFAVDFIRQIKADDLNSLKNRLTNSNLENKKIILKGELGLTSEKTLEENISSNKKKLKRN